MKGAVVSGIDIETPETTNYNYTIELRNRYLKHDMQFVDKQAVLTFMNVLRGYIGFKTKLGYFISSPDNEGTIVIPVEVFSNDDVTSYKELMRKKIIELKRYLEHEIDYDSFMNEHKIIFSALAYYKFDYNRALYITSKNLKNVVDVKMKPPTFEAMKITTYKYGEDEVLSICNPYLNQAMICADFSVPYGEMSFMYNALHVYEHIMCSPWVDIQTKQGKNGLLNMNGVTSGLGNCFVYCLTNTQEAFTTYFNELVKWMYGTREDGFWEKHRDHINMEISRTISETKATPYHLTFARSPGCAYSMDYNFGIFDYWSNKPFNITVIHPFKYDDAVIKELSTKLQRREVAVPEKPKLKWFPYSIPNMSSKFNMVTKRYEPKAIAKIVENYYSKHEIVDGNIALDVIKRDADPEGFGKGKILEYINMFIISTIRKYMDKKLHMKATIAIMSMIPDLEYLIEYNGDYDFEAPVERLESKELFSNAIRDANHKAEGKEKGQHPNLLNAGAGENESV